MMVPVTQRPVEPSHRLSAPHRASPTTQSAVHTWSEPQYCPLTQDLPTSHGAPHWIFESQGATRLSSALPQLATPPPSTVRARPTERPTLPKIIRLTARAMGRTSRSEPHSKVSGPGLT